jgi:HEAT repeat protein
MAVQAKCPNCDSTYTLADGQRGKMVRCRKCGEGFLVGAAKADESDQEPLRGGKLRKDGMQTSPLKAKAASRRGRDDDDEDEDDRRNRKPSFKKKSGSPWPLILIIGGVVLLLFLVCGGVLVFVVANRIPIVVNDIQANGADPNNPFAQAGVAPPKDVAEALDWLKTGDTANKKNAAADWLGKAAVDGGRRQEVAAALESVAANPSTHDAGIRGLATWAGPENAATLLKEVDSNNNLWAWDKGGDAPADALMRLKYEPAAAVFARRLPEHPQSAARRLAQLGPASEKEVLKYMDDPKSEVRAEVDGLLKQYHTKSETMFDQAVADLKNPDSGYERTACDYLAKTPVSATQRPEVSKALEGPLADKNGETREAAARALKTWGDKDNVPGLIALLDSEPPFHPHFIAAMDVLVALKDEKGAEAVARYLPDAFHNQDAVRGLRAMGPVAEKAVAGYVNNRDGGVRERAASLIKGYGTKPEVLLAAVIADLDAPEADQRKSACEWLAKTPVIEANQKEVARALDGLLNDPSPFGNVRQAAARAEAVWGDKDSVPALIRAMKRENSDVWQESVDALVALKDERAVVPLILETTNFFHKDQAKRALILMGPLVETALDNIVINAGATTADRIVACKLLASDIGTAKSLPALTTASKDANADVKKTAAAALAVVKKRS